MIVVNAKMPGLLKLFDAMNKEMRALKAESSLTNHLKRKEANELAEKELTKANKKPRLSAGHVVIDLLAKRAERDAALLGREGGEGRADEEEL